MLFRSGTYMRLSYDRQKPWEKAIPYFNRFVPDILVEQPKAYLIPQAWRHVIERLQWNGVQMTRVEETHEREVQVYRIPSVASRPNAYEGHMFHDQVSLTAVTETVRIEAGDYIISLDQDQARYAIETLEPSAHDSFFRWGFFNSVLEKKEAYSDYVFEDSAAEILRTEPETRAAFEAWKAVNPEILDSQESVLDFIFAHCRKYREPEWRRYPVYRLF